MTRTARILLAAAMALAGTATAASAGPDKFKLLRLDKRIVKWGVPALGKPAVVSYAFAAGPVHDARARNCKEMDALDGLAAHSGLSLAEVEAQAEAAFGQWSRVAGIRFERAATPAEADILIGAQARPRGYAFANVRYRHAESGTVPAADRALSQPSLSLPAPSTRAPVAAIERSAVCLNPGHRWKVGYGGDAEAYDLGFTFMHEIGHAIGLDHYNRRGQIMHFKYSETFAGPQAGDIEGLRRLYGPPPAPQVMAAAGSSPSAGD